MKGSSSWEFPCRGEAHFMGNRLVLASCHSPDFPELLLNARPKKNLSAEEAQNCNLVTKVVLLSLNTPLEAIQFLVATSEDKMSVGYLEPAGNNRKKRGDSYANKRHPMTLSKALGIFGHEQWSSLDKGKKQSNYKVLFWKRKSCNYKVLRR